MITAAEIGVAFGARDDREANSALRNQVGVPSDRRF
jgi:hypothetical protein